MISIQTIQDMIADEFFGGNLTIAGIIMYAAVLLLIFLLIRDKQAALIISIPLTFVFSILGIVDTNLMLLLLIVAIFGLALQSRKIWRD